MVILVYAERRSIAVGDIASKLARAFVARTPGASIALLGATEGALPCEGITREGFDGDSPPEAIVGRLASLATRNAVLLIAVTGGLTPSLFAACDVSERVLLVCDPSVPSVRGTQRVLKLCQSLGYGAPKVAIVLHGFSDHTALSPLDAATAFKRDIFWQLPDEHASGEEQDEAYAGLAIALERGR